MKRRFIMKNEMMKLVNQRTRIELQMKTCLEKEPKTQIGQINLAWKYTTLSHKKAAINVQIKRLGGAV